MGHHLTADVIRNFLIALLVITAPALAQDVPRLSIGSMVEGELVAGGGPRDVQVYALDATGEKLFEIRLTSTEFDTFLIAQSPVGERYENDDYRGSVRESRLYLQEVAVTSSIWFVGVTSAGEGETGKYRLEVLPTSVDVLQQERDLNRADELEQEATALYNTGRFAEGEVLAREALSIREDSLGSEHLAVAISLNTLARLLEMQGNYTAARPLYEHALAIREDQLEPEDPFLAESLNNLGLLQRAQGDYEAAWPLLERSLRIYEQALRPHHPVVAAALSNLAVLYYHMGRYDEARRLHERALAIRKEVLGAEDPAVADSLAGLGSLAVLDDNTEAWPLFERSLAIYEQALGSNHPTVANSLQLLAVLLEDQGDYAAALPLLERALDIHVQALGLDHPAVSGSLKLLALTRLAAGDGDPADVHSQLLQATAILDGHTDTLLPTLSLAEQQAFVAGDLATHTSVLLSELRGEELSTAYALFGGWKGLLLQGLHRQRELATLARADPALAPQVAELASLRGRIAHHFHRVGTLPPDEWRATHERLTVEKERLERALVRELPDGMATDPWRTLGLAGLRAALSEDAALVDLYRYDHWAQGRYVEPRYAAVVTTREQAPRLVDLGHAEALESRVADWREAVTRGGAAEAETWALVSAAWRPIEEALPEGTRRVWVSPDAQLARLPWSLLAAHAEEAEARAGRWLVAEISSPRALARRLMPDGPGRVASAAPEPAVLLVGDVDFQPPGAPPSHDGWAALPGTAVEVAALARLAERERLTPQVMSGVAATPEAVASRLPHARYAHLATHGFFYTQSDAEAAVHARRRGTRGLLLAGVDPYAGAGPQRFAARNPLVESGLALAGANAGPAGSLTAEELVGLDLSGVELLVLSACDTGRGAEITGQGVMGLRASLEAAGVGTLLMSLWKVPDESTALLMEHFYRGLWEAEQPPAEALRAAQATVRADPRFSAPLHWAAWVLSGESW